MRNLNKFINYTISILMVFNPPSLLGAEKLYPPPNHNTMEPLNDWAQQIEKVEIVEIREPSLSEKLSSSDKSDSEEGILPLGLKITFKSLASDAKSSNSEAQDKREMVLRIGETPTSVLAAYSPENIGRQKVIQELMRQVQSSAIKENNSFKNLAIRFPVEALMFYSVVAANSCMFSMASQIQIGARTNLTCLDTLKNSLIDPISVAGFAAFVGTSSLTQRAVYSGSSYLAQQFHSLSGLLNSTSRWLGPLGLAGGMLGSRIFEESLRDENIQICAKSLIQKERQAQNHCQTAFDNWFKLKRWRHYGVDAVGLVASSLLAHGILNGIILGAKQIPGQIGQGFLKALSFNIRFGKNAPASMKPQFEFLNKALAPLNPGSISSLNMFLTVDRSFVSKWTDKIKINDQMQYLQEEKFKIDQEIKRLIDNYSKEKYPINKNLDRQLRNYYAELSQLRQMKLGEVSETTLNWMNAVNKFLAVYQAAYQFYREFFWWDAIMRETDNSLARNPYLDQDYLNKVLSWINRGPLAKRPLAILVDSVEQPVTIGSFTFPLSALLQGAGYNGNEIANFPLWSKLETVTHGANQLMDALIKDIQSGYRKKNEKNQSINHLLNLQRGTPHWENELQLVLKYLDIQQQEILKIYQNLKAGDYQMLPEFVLTPKELRELKLESPYKIERENGFDLLVEQKEPVLWRDSVNLITRTDSRSLKDLKFRVAHIEEGLRQLEIAANKYKNGILAQAKNFIGKPSQASPPGTKYLSLLMSDFNRFPPEHYDYFPKSITYHIPKGNPKWETAPHGGIHSLRPVDYLMASMACGPSVYLLKPISTNDPDLLDSELIFSPLGQAIEFRPPGVTTISNHILKNEICGHQQSITDLYEKEFTIDGRKHYGFISAVRYYLKQELRGFVKGSNQRQLNFDLWWNAHVLPLAQGLLEKFQSEYYQIVVKEIIPIFTDKGVFQDLNEDARFSANLISQIYAILHGFTTKTANQSAVTTANQSTITTENQLALTNQLNSILLKIKDIQNILLNSASISKIFPNGIENNIDQQNLAAANAQYLKLQEMTVNEIRSLATALGIQAEILPNQEILISGGLKFPEEKNSEAQRTIETALRNLLNNINELQFYSDMIFVLTKKVDYSNGL